MSEHDEMASTMRIDIHPDFLGESLERKKQETQVFRRATDTSLEVRKLRDQSEASPYKKLLQSIYDAVLITDHLGKVVDFNRRALDFFLCDEEEMAGTNIIDRISGADLALLDSIRQNLKDHRYTLIEAHCVRSDRSMFASEIAVNNIDLDNEGQLCFFVRDITVRKRAQEALEDAVRRLEEHDRARSQFVSNVSHELRTPLTSMIYAVANMLRGVTGTLSDGTRRYLEMLEGDCKRLLGTVNDILDLRRIETKSLKLIKNRVPFGRIVQRSTESLLVQANQKGVALTMDRGRANWFVDCDAHKIERVFLNVVGNAVKFTPDGGSIAVQMRDDPARPGFVQVCVQDNGIGIPPEALPRVTERYFTVGDQPCGSGLGLAISKEIVELHGGAIEVRSPPPGASRGTVVRVSLPATDAPMIMVANSEQKVLDDLTEQIGGQGYGVVQAFTGLEATEFIQVRKPDAVVLDLILSEVDGMEIILKMKSEKTTVRIPIIVVTGTHVDRGKAQILNNFSIPVLGKPWDEEELLDRLESSLLGSTVGR
jgi:PAS domain S-box-containing protein